MKKLSLIAILLVFTACSKKGGEASAPPSAQADKGIGPVQSITVGALDATLAAHGKTIFQEKCSACHKIEEKYVGPALKGVTQRRTPEWVMNMILNPQEMTEKNATARDLLATHFTQMSFQNVTQDDARAILEFFRQNDAQPATK